MGTNFIFFIPLLEHPGIFGKGMGFNDCKT